MDLLGWIIEQSKQPIPARPEKRRELELPLEEIDPEAPKKANELRGVEILEISPEAPNEIEI